ncbi:LysR family transcriptional regulator [Micromonospora sp. NPDC049836]|uniref:LysR family transcriptional regulator n=1 Tax=Micromonospora sp. NPDC049836 TaxID=3364274 RepID=UPI0037A55E62
MKEKELRAFVAIADTRRMDQAAKVLNYSQPALSYQIQRLEQSIGAKLFIRDSTGSRLTRQGEMILPSVRAILGLMDNMRQAVQQHSDDVDAACGSPVSN